MDSLSWYERCLVPCSFVMKRLLVSLPFLHTCADLVFQVHSAFDVHWVVSEDLPLVESVLDRQLIRERPLWSQLVREFLDSIGPPMYDDLLELAQDVIRTMLSCMSSSMWPFFLLEPCDNPSGTTISLPGGYFTVTSYS